jgi:hypothetical protein
MKHVLHILAVSVLLGFSAVLPCGGVETATNQPPTPAELGITPPPPPDGYEFQTTTNGSLTLVESTEYEWELTFEWADDPSFTNVTAYPIVIKVPFEHDKGFVRVKARKVEK